MHTREIYAATTSASQTADIKLGKGDWEITTLSVIMGSTIPTLNGIEIGEGTVAFEVLEGDQDTVLETHYLMSGRCTRRWPMVMDCPKKVKGPGRIRSKILPNLSTEHTLSATYRRLND